MQLYQVLRRKSILQDASAFLPTRRSRRRALDLDSGDREYDLNGGVHFVRLEWYRAILSAVWVTAAEAELAAPAVEPTAAGAAAEAEAEAEAEAAAEVTAAGAPAPAPAPASASASAPASEVPSSASSEASSASSGASSAWTASAHAKALLAGLRLSCGPGGSREAFVQQSAVHLATLRLHSTARSQAQERVASPAVAGAAAGGGAPSSSALVACVAELELTVEALIELRAADALLRLLREKLLLSAKLLEHARADARARVRASMGRPKLGPKLVLALLSWRARRRPALEEQRTQLAMTCALLDRQFERLGSVQQLLLRAPAPLSASALIDPLGTARRALASRDGAKGGEGGKGGDGGDCGDAGKSCCDAGNGGDGMDADWTRAARSWTREARHLVSEIVREIVQSVSLEAAANSPATKASVDCSVLVTWVHGGDAEGWVAALGLVEQLPRAQRAQRYLLPGYAYFNSKLRGLPSSMASLTAALALHWALHWTIKPRWPVIVKLGQTCRQVSLGIYERRFRTPVRDIVLDLLNR